MEIRNLRTFIAVAEASGFRRAARNLATKQSVVSCRIRKLEDEIGVSLFERGHTGTRLTSAGEDFLLTARSVLDDLDHGFRRAANAGAGASGNLRIGIIASIGGGFAREAICAFKHRHPCVSIEIQEGSARDHPLSITERRLDIACVVGDAKFAELRTERLWTERVALALPADHPLVGEAEVFWSTLSRQRFIVSRDEPGPGIQEWLVPRLSGLGRPANIVRVGVARENLLAMVGLGFGFTVVSESATEVAYPGVVFRFMEHPDDRLPWGAIWSDENDNPALRRFLALMRAMSQGRSLPDGPTILLENAHRDAPWRTPDPSP